VADPDEIVSHAYRVGAGQFVRVASEQWLRRFWPLYLAYIGGAAAFYGFARDPAALFVLVAACVWPVTVPLRFWRAHLIKRDKGAEMQASISAERVRFLGPTAKPGKDSVSLDRILRVRRMAGCYLFYTSSHHYFFIPVNAFAADDQPRLESILRQRRLVE